MSPLISPFVLGVDAGGGSQQDAETGSGASATSITSSATLDATVGTLRVALHAADLHYGGDMVLHTASSGSVDRLETLYLHIIETRPARRHSDSDGARGALDRSDHSGSDNAMGAACTVGVGEVRINIAYLNGLAPETVLRDACRAVHAIDWRRAAHRMLSVPAAAASRHDTQQSQLVDGVAEPLATVLAGYSAPVRMLVDSALQDWYARRAGVSVASRFGAPPGAIRWATNQTLFWSPDEVMLARAARYVARGFHDLKLRVGIGSFADDLRRIDLLRQQHGDAVSLAVDANGQWSAHGCSARLAALAERGVDYVEQPIAAGDWAAIARLAETSPLTIMLDESLQSRADIAQLCALRGAPVAAHLKLVKLGGITATVAAAVRLRSAGVPFMIGQMNEGAAATAAALQVCCATRPDWAELYGADGLVDDPVSGVSYERGMVFVDDSHGLGVVFDSRSDPSLDACGTGLCALDARAAGALVRPRIDLPSAPDVGRAADSRSDRPLTRFVTAFQEN